VVEMKIKEKFEGVFLIDNKIATINLVPRKKVYGEELIRIRNVEYRIWDCWRSKPAAAIKKNIKSFPIKKSIKILYLGVASGTTCSHLSDIIGSTGIIYGIDIAERVLRDLIDVANKRGNIIPILADARKPENYEGMILDKIDLVYCDVASPDQIELFIRNCKKFLKPKGYAMIAVKSRSIDVTKPPEKIYKETKEKLQKDFEILDFVTLDPYEKDHGFFICRMK